MGFFNRKKTNKSAPAEINNAPAAAPARPDITALPIPKGDIMFHIETDGLKISDHHGSWLVIFNRMNNLYLQFEPVYIAGNHIRTEDFTQLISQMQAITGRERIRVCLYLPHKKAVCYIKAHAGQEKGSYENYFLMPTDQSHHSFDNRCIYTSDGGLLSIGSADRFFRPAGKFFITPDELQSSEAINLNSAFQTAAAENIYYGIFDRQDKSVLVLPVRHAQLKLSDVIKNFDISESDIEKTLYLCVIQTGKQMSSRYICMTDTLDPEDPESSEPLTLDHKYNSLITEPQSCDDHLYAAFSRTSVGSIFLQIIPKEDLPKYENSLCAADLSLQDGQSVFAMYDPEDDLTEEQLLDFTDKSIRALRNPDYNEAQIYRFQKRIIYNINEMLQKLSDTQSKFAPPAKAADDQWAKLHVLLAMIDDDIIMQSFAARYMKLFLLKCKYGRAADREEKISNILLKYGDTELFTLGSMFLRIDIVEVKNGQLSVEGYLRIPEAVYGEGIELAAYVNSTLYPCIAVERYSDYYILDKLYSKDLGFKVCIPLTEDKYVLGFGVRTEGFVSMCTKIEYTAISAISNQLSNAYFISEDYAVTSTRNRLICTKCSSPQETNDYETRLCAEITNRCGDRADDILTLRQYYLDQKDRRGEKEIWLLIDRADRADDNAEVLFRHLVQAQYPNIEPIFILSNESPQFEELSELGTVYDFHSEEHLKAFLTCKYVFSSQMAPSTTNPFNEDFDYFRDIIRQKHFVFLQHGVTHNDNGNAFSRYARNFYGIVVNANDEYNYMLTPEFNNPTDSIWLTGMPRFDMLHDDNRRMITIMPTWRKNLTSRVFDEEKGTNIWAVSDAFAESEYFNFYNSLINDPRVVQAANAHNYTIFFMPHPQFMSKADLFDNTCPECISICTDDIRYRDVFAMSSLILTDYSSVVFDFAYLHKPVLYAQFDKEAFFKAHTVKPGYYNFEDHGFGEVTYNYEDTVTNLVSYIENDCQMKEKYRQRVDSFFRYTDHNCCERICRKVFELEGKK